MAWTAPMTAAGNSTFTAAQFNTHVRDNLLETEVAKGTSVDNYLVSTGANAITQRSSSSSAVATMQTTSSTSYTSLATLGPTVSIDTGTKALVMWSCGIANTTANVTGIVSVGVSGATTTTIDDKWAIHSDGFAAWNNPWEPADQHNRRMAAKLFTLTAGTNIFTMQYKVSSGSGRFRNRELIVYPL